MYNDSEKRFTFLRGVCSDGEHPNLSRALGFAREMHKGQTRKSGEPYIIHPLSIACDAVGLGFRSDPMLATLVLHDVAEDTGTQVMDLPVDDTVKRAVECLTLRRMPDETKLAAKKRYYSNLRTDFITVIGKGLDRRSNLGSMAGVMPEASIRKNVYETWFFLLPLLKEAKMVWPEYSNQLHTIRTDLKALTGALAVMVHEEMPKDRPSDKFFEDLFGN